MPTYTLVFSIPELSLSKVVKTVTFPNATVNVSDLMTLVYNLFTSADFEDVDILNLLDILKDGVI